MKNPNFLTLLGVSLFLLPSFVHAFCYLIPSSLTSEKELGIRNRFEKVLKEQNWCEFVREPIIDEILSKPSDNLIRLLQDERVYMKITSVLPVEVFLDLTIQKKGDGYQLQLVSYDFQNEMQVSRTKEIFVPDKIRTDLDYQKRLEFLLDSSMSYTGVVPHHGRVVLVTEDSLTIKMNRLISLQVDQELLLYRPKHRSEIKWDLEMEDVWEVGPVYVQKVKDQVVTVIFDTTKFRSAPRKGDFVYTEPLPLQEGKKKWRNRPVLEVGLINGLGISDFSYNGFKTKITGLNLGPHFIFHYPLFGKRLSFDLDATLMKGIYQSQGGSDSVESSLQSSQGSLLIFGMAGLRHLLFYDQKNLSYKFFIGLSWGYFQLGNDESLADGVIQSTFQGPTISISPEIALSKKVDFLLGIDYLLSPTLTLSKELYPTESTLTAYRVNTGAKFTVRDDFIVKARILLDSFEAKFDTTQESIKHSNSAVEISLVLNF